MLDLDTKLNCSMGSHLKNPMTKMNESQFIDNFKKNYHNFFNQQPQNFHYDNVQNNQSLQYNSNYYNNNNSMSNYNVPSMIQSFQNNNPINKYPINNQPIYNNSVTYHYPTIFRKHMSMFTCNFYYNGEKLNVQQLNISGSGLTILLNNDGRVIVSGLSYSIVDCFTCNLFVRTQKTDFIGNLFFKLDETNCNVVGFLNNNIWNYDQSYSHTKECFENSCCKIYGDIKYHNNERYIIFREIKIMCDNPNDYQITSQSIDQQEIVEKDNQSSNQEEVATEGTASSNQDKSIIDTNLNNKFKNKKNLPKQIDQVYENIRSKMNNIHSIVESNLSNIIIDEKNLEKTSEFKESIDNIVSENKSIVCKGATNVKNPKSELKNKSKLENIFDDLQSNGFNIDYKNEDLGRYIIKQTKAKIPNSNKKVCRLNSEIDNKLQRNLPSRIGCDKKNVSNTVEDLKYNITNIVSDKKKLLSENDKENCSAKGNDSNNINNILQGLQNNGKSIDCLNPDIGKYIIPSNQQYPTNNTIQKKPIQTIDFITNHINNIENNVNQVNKKCLESSPTLKTNIKSSTQKCINKQLLPKSEFNIGKNNLDYLMDKISNVKMNQSTETLTKNILKMDQNKREDLLNKFSSFGCTTD